MRAWSLALALSSASASAGHLPVMTASQEARALIGVEYFLSSIGKPIAPGKISCTEVGWGSLSDSGAPEDEWSQGQVRCRGRTVITLLHKVGKKDSQDLWRIVDALLLPPIEAFWNPKRPNALSFSDAVEGVCELRGRPHIPFIVLIRWGKRKHIDWRTGVERAWTFDLKRGRIVPLSTKGFTCEWSEP
jgi:hypothetical protein